jgi:hypothetical protein
MEKPTVDPETLENVSVMEWKETGNGPESRSSTGNSDGTMSKGLECDDIPARRAFLTS